MRALTGLILLFLAVSCGPNTEEKTGSEGVVETGKVQATSLLGQPLYEPERSEESERRLLNNLEEARARLQQDSSLNSYIWYGRRMAYLSRYPEAIEIYSEALKKYPNSYRLYRHRGHRYISIRKFDLAIADLQKAADLMPKDTLEIEPDGIPNRINQPLSSTQFNVWYHLGLAYYLQGDFEKANEIYDACMQTSVNDDLLCATIDWKYMALRRMGNEEEAKGLLDSIHNEMNIIENDSYYNRLLMYKGEIEPQQLLQVDKNNDDPELALATQGYGVGNWYLYNADTTQAKAIFNQVLSGDYWSAFGYIAAEADMARLNKSK